MMRRIMMAGFLALAACSGDAPDTAATTPNATDPAQGEAAIPVPAAPAPRLTPAEAELLRSPALKDAIHRALVTGQNQRWEDAGLSGYAVPSVTPAPNGCRAVRYTVDQRPDETYQPINACDGTRPPG